MPKSGYVANSTAKQAVASAVARRCAARRRRRPSTSTPATAMSGEDYGISVVGIFRPERRRHGDRRGAEFRRRLPARGPAGAARGWRRSTPTPGTTASPGTCSADARAPRAAPLLGAAVAAGRAALRRGWRRPRTSAARRDPRAGRRCAGRRTAASRCACRAVAENGGAGAASTVAGGQPDDARRTTSPPSTCSPRATRRPGVASFRLTPLLARAEVQTRIRLAEDQRVVRRWRSQDGRVRRAAAETRVTTGGCLS